MTVDGNLLSEYTTYVTSAMTAFLPLWGAIIGVFIAFAIANMARFFIHKAAKK